VPGTIFVFNDDPQYFLIHYLDNGDPTRRAALQAQWQTFNRADPARKQTYKIWVRPTNPTLEVMVEHQLPPASPAGRYRVETFVPGKHATTRQAIFSVAHNIHRTLRGDFELDENLAIIDMYELSDVWQPLGEFQLDPSLHPKVGRVCQYDISRENPLAEIAFGPVRWVPLAVLPPNGLRFDSPVGSPEERQASFPSGRVMFGRYPVWAGDWFDVNPFLNWYTYGYHTGADLNLPGTSAADKGKPIYAISDGQVTYAGKAGSWGSIIVIEHPEAFVTRPDGGVERQPVYSRYGHVEDQILVRAGEVVQRGQHIGYIGLARGAISGWHLHFDVSYTDILKRRPAHWPDLSGMQSMRGSARESRGHEGFRASIMRQVLSHYVDPLRFVQDNHNATG
jgi:murein DD-endopeptidase MepM/ murein hydrolase activator NlpD